MIANISSAKEKIIFEKAKELLWDVEGLNAGV